MTTNSSLTKEEEYYQFLQDEEQKTNKHQRNIPVEGEFMKKCYNDLVYAYLQCKSYKGVDEDDNEVYFVYQEQYRIPVLAKATRIHGRTVRRKLDALMEGGFVRKGKVYNKNHTELVEVLIIEKINVLYQKIRIDTLQYLIDATNDCVIKTYAYLINKCLNVNDHYRFTKAELIQNCLGLSSTTNCRDYEHVSNILSILQKIGLIQFDNVVIEVNGQLTHNHRITSYSFEVKK